MDLNFTSLYIQDNKGSTREWMIGCEDDTIIIKHGLLNGSMQTQIEQVEKGKAGRSLNEQIMSRIASRIHKQRDKGYSNNIEDTQLKPVNSLGLFKPMLAQKIINRKNIDFKNAFLQPKLDGNRMLITNYLGEIIAYTRNGKKIETLDHIISEINIPEGTTIDGEIYCHGETLQTIVSWVKRKQENTSRLRYHVYDLIDDKTFKERFANLSEFNLGTKVDFVTTVNVFNMEEVMNEFRSYRNQGYEGAILRLDKVNYEDGKRSKSLLKIKEWFEDEFLVIGIKESKDNWGILECNTRSGKLFTVSAPGTMKNKKMILNNKENYIGRYINIEYSQITKDKIPFQPTAIYWKD